MANRKAWLGFASSVRDANLPFLIFLTGIVNVKLYVKLAAIVFYAAYLLYKKYPFPKKVTESPGWFYLLIIPLGLIGAWVNGSFAESVYWRGFGIASLKWVTAGAAFYLVVATKNYLSIARIIATIQAFFVVNALVSTIDLVIVMVDSQRWIPYWINDRAEYGISTGDYIRGLTRDNSVSNAAINLMGLILFLFRKQIKWVLLCLVVLALCTSNFSMILLLISLVSAVIMIRERKVKIFAIACGIVATALYAFLSMQNVLYSNKTIQNEINNISLGTAPASWRANPISPSASDESDEPTQSEGTIVEDLRGIQQHLLKEQHGRLDTGTARRAILEWYGVQYDESDLAKSGVPGKLYALTQAGSYMTSGIRPFLIGAGTGNFASNLAIKMTGLGIHGHYPSKYIYVHEDFLDYHLYIWLYAFAHTREFQSVTQLPANVYSQLGGEYGVIGLGLFFGCYIFYFLKRNRFSVRALILTGILLGYFFVDYWFEMISLTVIFELFMINGNALFTERRIHEVTEHTT